MTYVCIGAPYWIGERQQIAAVDAVKNSGIADELGADWVDIQPDYATYDDKVVAVNVALAEAITAHAEKTPLIFAGDCVFALGALKGLQDQHPAVIWYDAHGDFNTPETTPSGFLGGMPLAALVGMGNESLMQAVGLTPIPEADVVITDARDLDPAEGDNLRQSALVDLPDVNALNSIDLPEKPLYVHFDTDIVNGDEMPGMNYPAEGGPSLAESSATMQRIARDGQIAGVLFSLWNQEKDGADTALASTLQVVRDFVAVHNG